MPPDSSVEFPPFRLDLPNQQLWRGSQLVPLRPKPFAVLAYLATHAGRLVPRLELVKAVWPDTHVGEGVLRGYIRELRIALGDHAGASRFIETAARRGYRFIGPLVPASTARARGVRAPGPRHPGPTLVGRETELARLDACLGEALAGTPQVVFVTGEPGIGKTTVVDTFLARAGGNGDLWTVRGQCVEHFGAGEAYLPMLEALGQLRRQPGGERLVPLLRRYAPTWLVQMPALVDDRELEAVQRRAEGATRERMLRELAEAIEVVTAAMPVVLVLEDLQWSDYSTLDLLSLVAQRRGPAHLLLLGTYRPADVIATGHPLRAITQELRAHGQGREVALGLLTAADVTQYLAARFPRRQFPPELGPAIHRRTEGNPLFMVNVVDYWVAQGVLAEADGTWRLAARVEDIAVAVPESLRQMIEKQLERLTPEEGRMLEAASTAGVEFSTAAVAAALAEKEERIEDWCEGLARTGRFLRARGVETLAKGTATGRYGFIHALYQQVLYERLASARRVRLHQRLGEWEEDAYGARVGEHAAELGMHFERGEDHERALRYLAQAADNAMRRQAPHEAAALLGDSLTLLKTRPDTPERTSQELALLVAMGVPLLTTRGYAAPEVERTYARARELCGKIGESPQLLPALAGLFRFYFVRADFQAARALADHILRLAERTGDPLVFLVAHSLLGVLFLSMGEFVAAREQLDKGIGLYDPQEHRFMASLYGDDPGVTCHCFAGMSLWFLGYPDQALAHVETALALADALGMPYSRTFALDFVTWIRVNRREERAAQDCVTALMPIATEHGFQFLLADGRVLYGWILAALGHAAEGLLQVRPAIAAYDATGAVMSRPSHLSLLAKVYAKAGRIEEGLAALEAALAVVAQTGERSYEAEMYRLRGELMLDGSRPADRRRRAPAGRATDAEACFRRAIDVARGQQAKSLELRAATSMSRSWQQRGKRVEARQLLAPVVGWFTEGLETADLEEARALLASMS